NSKLRTFGFDIVTEDEKTVYPLATETQKEMEEWLLTLGKAIGLIEEEDTIGKLKELSVYGKDYPTPDGTGIRDYIHIIDLAKGHVSSLNLVDKNCGLQIFNLGAGRGYSVLEVIGGMRKASGREVAYKVVGRREGDVPVSYSDASKAEREMGWKALKDIEEMCSDAWRWQVKNPQGYINKK
ncbi:PREDICTED: uncharacterized protein LOC100634416, partial [Amphimedon queenslandica]|uniref:UDP-glucose 4-epimerase n=1 Tax=Amphimedon queenslandica TaxID=400682 RepID=A0AAN0JW57_AMPQE